MGVVWFATYLVFLGTAYGTKRTYRSGMNSFYEFFSLLNIESPFIKEMNFSRSQVDMFTALATIAYYKAESAVRVAKCAAENT